tara:strand:- start:332 stop:520 length:189 start_codon:yes stop_codon:yes gene_type:complete
MTKTIAAATPADKINKPTINGTSMLLVVVVVVLVVQLVELVLSVSHPEGQWVHEVLADSEKK